jgi:lipopolysaccharide transport system permease protein
MDLKEGFGLSISLANANFKLRNEGSYLGILWYLLNPVIMFVFLYLIFSERLGINIPNYPLYLFLGIILFNFFQSATIESTRAIEYDKAIIKSINFPKEALIGGIVIKSLFAHFFEILLFFIIAAFFNIPFINIFYYLIILFFLVIFIFGISLVFSSITVYFIDFDNIWNFISRILWFITPIFYAIGEQNRLFYLNLFNPMFYFLTASRDMIIYSKMSEPWIFLGIIFYSLFFLLIGMAFFNKLKNKFAERI